MCRPGWWTASGASGSPRRSRPRSPRTRGSGEAPAAAHHERHHARSDGSGAGDEHRGELAHLHAGHQAGDDEREQDDDPEPQLRRVGGAGAHQGPGIGRDVAHAHAHEDPQAFIFEELSHDIPHNRILRSTLAALLRVDSLDVKIRAQVGLAYRKLEGISVIRVDGQAFRQVQLDRNRQIYRFLLSVCELLHRCLLVSEDSGDVQFRDFREDSTRMWELFENFVTEFYRREQSSYRVKRNLSTTMGHSTGLIREQCPVW